MKNEEGRLKNEMLDNLLKTYLVISLMFICWLISGCTDVIEVDENAAKENLQIGWQDYDKGKFDSALLSFERAVSLDNSLSDAHNGLGWSHLSASQSDNFNQQLIQKALVSFQESIKRDENNADAWVGLANALFLRRADNQDFITAAQAIDNALKTDSTLLYRHDYKSEADLHALKAVCYYYAGDIQSARGAIENTTDIEKGNKTAIAIQELLSYSIALEGGK